MTRRVDLAMAVCPFNFKANAMKLCQVLFLLNARTRQIVPIYFIYVIYIL